MNDTPEIAAATASLTDAADRLDQAARAWPPARRTVKRSFAAAVAASADVERWLDQLQRLHATDVVILVGDLEATIPELAAWAAEAADTFATWSRDDVASATSAAARSAAQSRSTTAQRRAAVAARRAARYAIEVADAVHRRDQDAIAAEAEKLR